MCEAIAQVGAIAVLTDERFAGKLPLFGGLDGARFRRQVGPGDELSWRSTLGRMSARAGKGSGRALRRRRRVACSATCCSSSSTRDPRFDTTIGLIGAVVLFVGIALLFAFEQPPFVPPDETAHLGYAHEIADLELPEITEPPDVPDSAVQWQAERESGRDDRYRAVWVANHPPLHYLASAPLIWLSDATDRPDGGLMFMRLANIAFAAAGVVFTYLLARDLSGGGPPHRSGRGGDRRPRSAGARAVLRSDERRPRVRRGNGGRLGRGPMHRHAVRPLRAQLTWSCSARLRRRAPEHAARRSRRRRRRRLGGRRPAAHRAGTVGRSAGGRRRPSRRIGLIPAAVLFGWYYVRNNRLYGDFAGSEFLLDRFGRMPRGSLFEVLTWGHLWVDLYHMLMSPSPLFTIRAPLGSTSRLLLVAIGLVVVAIRGRTGDVVRRGVHGVVTRPALGLCIVVVFVVVVTVAQHVSGGGSRYARYLLPALGCRRRPVRPRARSSVAAGPARRHRGADGVVGAAQRPVGRRSGSRATAS